MAEVTPRQTKFIQKLAAERRASLTPAPDWLTVPKTSYEASTLIKRLLSVPEDPKPVFEGEQSKMDRIEANINNIAGGLRTYAVSFVQQWKRKKSLSDKQWELVDKMIESLDNPFTDPEPGFYKDEDDEVVFVFKSRHGNTTTKTLTDTNQWKYTGQAGLRRVVDKLTDKEMADLGRRISGTATGLCVACLAENRDPTLTDPRSIAVGYGATCASKYGWYYPSKEEAEEILNKRMEQSV